METSDRINLLVDFINQYLVDTSKQAVDLAKDTGITAATISRLLNGKTKELPESESLIKYAKGMSADIRTLAAVIAPDHVKGSDPELLVLAERLRRLSQNERKLVNIFVAGILAEKNRKDS